MFQLLCPFFVLYNICEYDFCKSDIRADFKNGAKPWLIAYIDFVLFKVIILAMLLSGNMAAKVALMSSLFRTEQPLTTDFNVHLISALVEPVSPEECKVVYFDVVSEHEVEGLLSMSWAFLGFLKKFLTLSRASWCFLPSA